MKKLHVSLFYSGSLFFCFVFVLAPSLLSKSLPPYNRTDSIFITEFFHALEDKNYSLALRKLERMNELQPGSLVFFDLIRELKENRIIEKVEVLLKEENYEEARIFIKEAIAKERKSERLNSEMKKIEGITLLKGYLEEAPYENADHAYENYNRLLQPDEFSETSGPYKVWYLQQKEMVDNLFRLQTIRLIHEIIDEIDLAILSNSSREELLKTQFIQFIKNDDPSREWNRLLVGDVDIPVNQNFLNLGNDHLESGKINGVFLKAHKERVLEFAMYHLFQGTDQRIKKEIKSFFSKKNPSTWTGTILDTQLSFENGDFFTGFTKLMYLYKKLKLFDGTNIYDSIKREYFRPPRHSIKPTISDVFDHLHFIQSQN